MGKNSQGEDQDGEWLKRIQWCVCEWPINDTIEAIVSLVVEGYLSHNEAIENLQKELKLLEIAESMPLAVGESEVEHQVYFQTARSDFQIALEFVRQVELRQPPGVVARRQILEQVIAGERGGHERRP